MYRKMIGVFTAVAAALLLVGVAWANSGDSTASTSLDDATSTSVASDSSTTDVTSSSSTSVDGGTVTTLDGGSSSSTTVDDNSSTTTPSGSTSTTLDDDDDEGTALVDGVTVYSVGLAGTATIEVKAGQLALIAVSPNAGWTYEVEKSYWDEIEVRFEKGESEAEIEVEIEDGKLQVKIESKTD
ncbi:MAG: hypothetical protein OEM39_07800 [Acidimicrobiia bacterium]|nr:hypothetical protein [Acidimicrobiia bacterium]MDH3464111.1 hypothetical protein [Acidimicrobiia bacterium]